MQLVNKRDLYCDESKAFILCEYKRELKLIKKLINIFLIVRNELQRINESSIKVIAHNGKFDYQVLKCTCDVLVVPYWDTMVATRLLNENENYGLKYQYTAKIDNTQEEYNIEKLFKNVQYADVKPEIFALYSAVDPYMTYRLYEYQFPIMESEKKIFNLFMTIEMPLVTVVAEMELCGAWADVEYCKKLKEKYESKLIEIDAQLNDEILKIKPIIEKWKTSASGLERDRVFPPESRAKAMTEEQLEQKYPLYDPISNLRYRHGRSFASQLKDPINLSSPKQLGIDIYKLINDEFEPGSNFTDQRRENIKKYALPTYFEKGSDQMLGKNLIYKLGKIGIDKKIIDDSMGRLRQALVKAVGGRTFGSDIFYIESCVYLMTLYDLLCSGHMVWLVYDAFYSNGPEDDET